MNKLLMLAAGLLLSAGIATYAVSKSNTQPAATCPTESTCDASNCTPECCDGECCWICK